MDKSSLKKIGNSLPTIIMCITTIIACFMSYLVWESEERANYISERDSDFSNRINTMSLELERYRQTIQLCDKINDLYKGFNASTNTDVVEFKIWEMGKNFECASFSNISESRVRHIYNNWTALSDQQRLERLIQNSALKNLFYCFEDAMMLHQKGLLDNRYFDNYLSNVIDRIHSATNPTVDEFIDELCLIANRNDIWEGYRFCRDSIMLEPIIVATSGDISRKSYVDKIFVSVGDTVKAGAEIFRLKNDEMTGDKFFTLCSTRNGIIDKLLTHQGDSVRVNQIIAEIRPR